MVCESKNHFNEFGLNRYYECLAYEFLLLLTIYLHVLSCEFFGSSHDMCVAVRDWIMQAQLWILA
jgi:hypothetical protein